MLYIYVYMLYAPALLDLFKCFEKDGWKTNVPKAYIVLTDQFGSVTVVSCLTFCCIHPKYLYLDFLGLL